MSDNIGPEGALSAREGRPQLNSGAPLTLRRCVVTGAACWLCGAVIVISAASFACRFLPVDQGGLGTHQHNERVTFRRDRRPGTGGVYSAPRLIDRLATTWDGQWYRNIAQSGYAYFPEKQSNPAFFPAYPLLVRGLAALGMDLQWALVIVSNGALLAALCLLFAYASLRFPADGDNAPGLAVICCTLFPATFYYRFGYSEPVFLAFAVLAMFLMERKSPLWLIAVVVGAATATRPVAVALLAPFAWELWERSGRSRPAFVRSVIAYGPLAAWGLIAYIAYLAIALGEPSAFLSSQIYWAFAFGFPWSNFDAQHSCHWTHFSPGDFPVLNMFLANPLFFALMALLIIGGARAKWLNRREVLLSALLLLIPLFLNGFRLCMASHARFASVVFPAYLVMGRMLADIPRVWTAIYFAICSCLLAGYTAMFTGYYSLF